MIWVKPFKNGCRCHKCKRECGIIRDVEQCRKWSDIPSYGWDVFLYYWPKIILCPTHGTIQENIPWAEPHSHVTYRFEHAVLIYCQLMTQKAAAGILNIPTSTLSDILHRSIN